MHRERTKNNIGIREISETDRPEAITADFS
jgi:hypothetical protein